jgi:hypothetical protein
VLCVTPVRGFFFGGSDIIVACEVIIEEVNV